MLPGLLPPVFRCMAAILLPATTSGWPTQNRLTNCPVVTGMTHSTCGVVAWLVPGEWTITRLLTVMVVFLATASAVWAIFAARYGTSVSGKRSDQCGIMPSHLLAALAAALFGLVVTVYVVNDLLNRPHHDPQPLDWLALATTCVAITVHLWDATARFPLWGLYAVGFMLDGMLLVQRDLSPGRFFVWTGTCELTGLLLVAAQLGWTWQRLPVIAAVLKIPGGADRWRGQWFCWTQAVLAAVAVLLIAWILLDPSCDDMGEGKALFGLSGHWASCPAGLMLLGMSILMAWQTRGRWRGGWQYAAMCAGILFTSSIGWARINSTFPEAWSKRILDLLVSASMMTLLTRFGLARVLPWSGDWITRARRAAPVFGSAALLLAIVALIQWAAS